MTPRLPLPTSDVPVPASVRAPAPLPASASARVAPEPSRRYSSDDLFGGSVEVEIEHGSSVYRLRRTSLGKLILTK